jgi:hypothetical protein
LSINVYGLDREAEAIRRVKQRAQETPAAMTHGGDRKSENQGAHEKVITLKRGSNSAAYLTARIARDAEKDPDASTPQDDPSAEQAEACATVASCHFSLMIAGPW